MSLSSLKTSPDNTGKKLNSKGGIDTIHSKVSGDGRFYRPYLERKKVVLAKALGLKKPFKRWD